MRSSISKQTSQPDPPATSSQVDRKFETETNKVFGSYDNDDMGETLSCLLSPG